MSLLLKKGSLRLVEQCVSPITTFPVLDEVTDAIDACNRELRQLKGFWKGKGMSIASTQVGYSQTPLFVMCAREYWYTHLQYKKFQSFLNPKVLEFSEEKALAWEGCISNDDQMCLVERPLQVRV